MRLSLTFFFLLLSAVQVWAVTPTITLYLDGAVVEQEILPGRNPVEIPLPPGTRQESVRVTPSGGTVIDQVEVVTAPKVRKREDERGRLLEKQDQLKDRLKALETREEIFRAAAKSQSGKAPRKTKSNPEPLSTIRQGTDFALAQLEEVYRIRRKTEKELKDLQAKTSTGLVSHSGEEGIARVWLTGKGGKAILSYVRSDLSMKPRYDFRLDGSGKVGIFARAEFGGFTKGFTAGAVMRKMGDVSEKPQIILTSYRNHVFDLPAERENFTPGPFSTLSFSVTNSTSYDIPAGVASFYWKGAYLGTASFTGLRAGEVREITSGK